MPFTFKLAQRLARMKRVPVIGAAVVLVACRLSDHLGIPSLPDQPVQIVVAPESVALDPYQTQQFRASGRTAVGDSMPVTVSWSASAGPITQSGLYTADTSAADVVVTATYSAGQLTGTATTSGATQLTGTSRVKKKRLVRVVMNPQSSSVPEGGVQQFTVYGLKNTGDSVSVSVGYVATGGTITPNGVYTAGQVPGTFRVIANQNGGSLADTAAVSVTIVPVASVSVSPASATVLVGQTVQLTATPKDANGNPLSGRVVTWATSAASVTTVSAGGLVTGVAAGTATITATSEGNGGTSAIMVTTVPVASVTVSPASASLLVGQTVQLTATPKDANGNPLSGRVVTWTTSAASVTTVSAGGLVTGVAAGTATITATSEGNSAIATITVANVPVAAVTVSPATPAILVSKTVQLTATPKDAAGNPLSGRVVTWATSATSVATVSATGLVTGVTVGTATITATSEGKSGSAAVTVNPVPVASVTVSPGTASIPVGGTVQLSATPKDSAGNPLSGRTVAWATSAASVATVTASGLVTGVTAGTATITATSGGKSGTATITVTSSTGVHAGYYASPNGSSAGDGSVSRPWDLPTALNGGNGKVQPGDTIWLRGGTYTSAINTTVTGTAAAPIVVRQYPGERAILDANGGTSGTSRGDFFIVSGSYVTFWGFEVMDSDPNRLTSTRPNLVIANASHLKFINLIVHDGGIGFYTYPEQTDIEIYGCLIYNNGWQQPDFGNGHGIYAKSTSGPVYLRDNVIFNQFGYGVHVYANAGSGGVNNIHVEGNVSFNNGAIDADPVNSPNANILYGGGDPATGGGVVDNMTFFSPNVGVHNLVLGYSSTANIDLTVQNTYAVGGQAVYEVGSWQSFTMTGNSAFGSASSPVNLRFAGTSGLQLGGNRYYRDPAARAWLYNGGSYTFTGWQQATGVGATDQAQAANPAQPQVFVRPSRYEAGRANVIIYNWTRQASVAVALSGVLPVGARYEIRNVQDFFGTPVVSGTYGGGTVSIPMSGVTAVQPIGGAPTAPPRTGPDFDAFVVVVLAP